MAIKLEEMKVGMSDKVGAKVIDTFLRESEILQMLPFDNCVSGSGGSTLTYSYVQKKLPAAAAFRALNTEYEEHAATVEKKSADLKVFGGTFGMDRVLKQAEGKYNNMSFQIQEQIQAAVSLFHYTLINGDATTHNEEFDGLDKMLAGTTTEYNSDAVLDISTAAKLKENADQFYEMLTTLIRETSADALLLNTKTLTKIQTLARILGYKTESEEAFGKNVVSMDGVRLMDLKNHYTVSGSSATAVSCVKDGITREVSGSQTGLTDIYAVKFDVNDGFHGATLTGSSVISQYIPDFKQPGAVKKAEVEMVGATILKNTRKAGVIRNLKLV